MAAAPPRPSAAPPTPRAAGVAVKSGAPVPPMAPPPRHVIQKQMSAAAEVASFLAAITKFERTTPFGKQVGPGLRKLPQELAMQLMAEVEIRPLEGMHRIEAVLTEHELYEGATKGEKKQQQKQQVWDDATKMWTSQSNSVKVLKASPDANSKSAAAAGPPDGSAPDPADAGGRPGEPDLAKSKKRKEKDAKKRYTDVIQRIKEKVDAQKHPEATLTAILQFVQGNRLKPSMQQAICMLPKQEVQSVLATKFAPASSPKQIEDAVMQVVRMVDEAAASLSEELQAASAVVQWQRASGGYPGYNPWMPMQPGAWGAGPGPRGMMPMPWGQWPWMMPGAFAKGVKKKKEKKKKAKKEVSSSSSSSEEESKGKSMPSRDRSRPAPRSESRERSRSRGAAGRARSSRGGAEAEEEGEEGGVWAEAALPDAGTREARLQSLLSALPPSESQGDEWDAEAEPAADDGGDGWGAVAYGEGEHYQRHAGFEAELPAGDDWGGEAYGEAEGAEEEEAPDAAQAERSQQLHDWLLQLDSGRGVMLQYFEPLRREFNADLQLLVDAVRLPPEQGGSGALGCIDPHIWSVCGIQAMGHKLLLARGINALP